MLKVNKKDKPKGKNSTAKPLWRGQGENADRQAQLDAKDSAKIVNQVGISKSKRVGNPKKKFNAGAFAAARKKHFGL